MSEKPEAKPAPEISVTEFLKLSEEVPEKGKVKEAELLVYITETAKTTSGIADHFKVTYSAMWSRLTRLRKAGSVIRKYKAGKAFWLKRPANIPPQVVAEEEEPEEVPEEMSAEEFAEA